MRSPRKEGRMSDTEKIEAALHLISRYGGIDGEHHKTWVLDQAVRLLVGADADYQRWVADQKAGDDGPDTYAWDVGIPP
jgi:hypothetical protein